MKYPICSNCQFWNNDKLSLLKKPSNRGKFNQDEFNVKYHCSILWTTQFSEGISTKKPKTTAPEPKNLTLPEITVSTPPTIKKAPPTSTAAKRSNVYPVQKTSLTQDQLIVALNQVQNQLYANKINHTNLEEKYKSLLSDYQAIKSSKVDTVHKLQEETGLLRDEINSLQSKISELETSNTELKCVVISNESKIQSLQESQKQATVTNNAMHIITKKELAENKVKQKK
jgi:hypothetical protein